MRAVQPVLQDRSVHCVRNALFMETLLSVETIAEFLASFSDSELAIIRRLVEIEVLESRVRLCLLRRLRGR